MEDLDDDMTEYSDAQKRRSITQPMVKDKRRKTGTISTEDSLLEETLPAPEATQTKTVDADDVFGQHVAASLRNIKEYRSKEYLKVRIQELIFEAQFGMLPMPSRQANIRPGPSAFLPICQHLVHSNANQGNTDSATYCLFDPPTIKQKRVAPILRNTLGPFKKYVRSKRGEGVPKKRTRGVVPY